MARAAGTALGPGGLPATACLSAEDPVPGPSEDTRQGEVCSEGQPSPRVPVPTLGLPAPGRGGGGGAPRPHKRCWGPVAQICPEGTVSTTGGVRGGWWGRGLGSPPTMSAPPGSMAACPVLGLAALLCLFAPQAGSVVQYRPPVSVAVGPVALVSQMGWASQNYRACLLPGSSLHRCTWCFWNPKVWLRGVAEGGAGRVGPRQAASHLSPTDPHRAGLPPQEDPAGSLPRAARGEGRQGPGPTGFPPNAGWAWGSARPAAGPGGGRWGSQD